MLIINDVHIGFDRKGGTTPASREALRSFLFSRLERLLSASTDQHTLIAGDLFDAFAVTERDLLQTYSLLAKHLDSGKFLILAAGNHDWSPRGEAVSSFQLLATILQSQYQHQVAVVNIDEHRLIGGVMVVAHHSNQTKFDETLRHLASTLENTPVVLHANFDNGFVADSDHSLNVSREQAVALLERNCKPIFAHEHQAREVPFKGLTAGPSTIDRADGVYVLGNQWPTSISDCLNNDTKSAHTLSGQVLLPFTTWSRNDHEVGYREINWREISSQIEDDRGFIRIVGDATAAEASLAVSTIANFRQRSDAFVISNAVKVDGIAPKEDMEATADEVKSFDVLAYIRSELTDPDELTLLDEMLAKLEA